MKKYIASLIFFISVLFAVSAQSANIPNELSSVLFKIDKTSRHKAVFTTSSNVFNAAYSSALPVGCIYKIKAQQNNREVIVQIEHHPENLQNDTVYLSDDAYNFLTLEKSSLEQSMNVQLSFLGWCNERAQSDFLNIQSLVVEPKDSRREIIQNGLDKYYIQLGAFEFYQNSFGLITNLLPYLQIRPNFYITKTVSRTSHEDVFRVLAGPYSYDDAVRISGFINSFSKDSVMLKSSTGAIKGDKKK